MITPREFAESIQWFGRYFQGGYNLGNNPISAHPITSEIFPDRGHSFLRGTVADEMELFYRFCSDWLWGCGKRAQMEKDKRVLVEKGGLKKVD